MSFPVKHPAERVYAGTDWTDELEAGETISSATVDVSVKRGKTKDGNPSAIVSGSATWSGAIVSQLIIDGVSGVDYETVWIVVTSTRTLVERVILLVR